MVHHPPMLFWDVRPLLISLLIGGSAQVPVVPERLRCPRIPTRIPPSCKISKRSICRYGTDVQYSMVITYVGTSTGWHEIVCHTHRSTRAHQRTERSQNCFSCHSRVRAARAPINVQRSPELFQLSFSSRLGTTVLLVYCMTPRNLDVGVGGGIKVALISNKARYVPQQSNSLRNGRDFLVGTRYHHFAKKDWTTVCCARI
jgi:hypothetical protein